MVKITKVEDVMNLIGNLRKDDLEELEAMGSTDFKSDQCGNECCLCCNQVR